MSSAELSGVAYIRACNLEIYSIDEAFLSLEGDRGAHAHSMRIDFAITPHTSKPESSLISMFSNAGFHDRAVHGRSPTMKLVAGGVEIVAIDAPFRDDRPVGVAPLRQLHPRGAGVQFRISSRSCHCRPPLLEGMKPYAKNT
jgi:hypothetical protein